jgi:methionyl-tRNA synthetase
VNHPSRYTVTAALPYTNGPVHIGHLAGVYVPADIYVRFLRNKYPEREVAFICGSDEHGVAITLKARKEGTTPQAIIDKYDGIIRKSFADFGISFSNYSRTSKPIHHETAQELFKDLYEKDVFIEKTSKQYFDEKEQQFLADRYIQGTCPKCSNPDAYGDQCENCGSTLSPKDLGNPKSMLSGEKPILKETKHWYFPLDKYEEKLRKWILEDHKEWKNNVTGQCKSWLDGGLQPRPMTRDLDWGVKVPVKGAEGKVMYVWFDAPIGYISSTKEWAAEKGIDWEPFWKDDETKLVHFIGKDNIVFHCIIFPAMLMAHGDYILPDNVPANEFLNLEGQKISTSRNWAVWLHEYLVDFPEKQDVLRYVLTANAPENKDNDFTWSDFQARNNNELVAVLGNFINRVCVLTHKYYDGVVPAKGEITEVEKNLLFEANYKIDQMEAAIEDYKFRQGAYEMMEVARLGNKYLAELEPWKLVKTDPNRVENIMHAALQIAAKLSVIMEPFLPFSSDKLQKMLNFDSKEWKNCKKDEILKSGHKLNEASLLFEKIEDEKIVHQMAKLKQTKDSNMEEVKTIVPTKDAIEFDDFMKLDIRVGTILEAQKVPKADKLLQFKVDTGVDVRTIVSGIAEQFIPEELIGKQVSVLINLAPRKMRGVVSEGMILLAENEKGELTFVLPEKGMPNGAIVR